LEEVWPEVGGRLLRFLRARGTDASSAEDIVQEVALRVVALDVSYESAEDLMRWAATAARNLAIDEWRANSRYGAAPLEEVPSTVDVDETVEHRLRLEAVGQSWMRLSERDREALKTGALGTKAASRREGVRWAVQRHAARARLAAMVDGVAAVLGWVGARLRYRPRRAGRTVMIASLPALVIVAALLPRAFDILTPGGGGGADRRVTRDPEQAAASVSTPPTDLRSATPPPSVGAPHGAARGAAPHAAQIVPYKTVEVGRESGVVYRWVRTGPKRPDDSLVCLYDIPIAGSPCFNPPLPPLPTP
jgi:hypothetical protein